MITKLCVICAKPFTVIRARRVTAKYCCTTCRDIGLKKAPNQICSVCGKPFHMKKSQIDRYARNLGIFCSNTCAGTAKAIAYSGENNPNYKGRNTDQDGYRLYTPPASYLFGLKRMKLHQAVCCEVLGIPRIPKGIHIHHRDCNTQNNAATNLVALSASDHKWLHQQFGVATLWAFCLGKLDLQTLLEWTDNKEKAKALLPLDITQQTASQLNEGTLC